MNTFDSTTAASGPMVGLIELPELAELLSACGLQVVTGPDFRSAATAIRDAFKSAGEFPIITADVSAPSLRTWLTSIRQVTSIPVGVVRSDGAPVLDIEGAVEFRGPFSVDSMLLGLGLEPLGGAGGSAFYPFAPAAAADPFAQEAAPGGRRAMRAAAVPEDPFADPAPAAPSSRRAAREAEQMQTPDAGEAPVSRRGRRAQEAAPEVPADTWDEAPSYQGAPAVRQAPPTPDLPEDDGFNAPYAPPSAAEPAWDAPAEPVFEQPRYAAPEQQWAEPVFEQPRYAAPEPQYTAPEPEYAEQQWPAPAEPAFEQPRYAAPEQQYQEPQYAEQQWPAPAEPAFEQPRYAAPEQQYAAPEPQFAEQQWSAPAEPAQPAFEQPRYAAPEQQWSEPSQPAPAQPVFEQPRYAAPEQQWSEPAGAQQPPYRQQPRQAEAPGSQQGYPRQQDPAAAFFNQAGPQAPEQYRQQGALGMTGRADASKIFDAHESSKLAGTGRSAAGLGSFIIDYSGKGGVGKSTTSLQLAKVASEAGLSVILIDGNSGQGDLLTYLRLNRTNLPTIYDAAIGDVRDSILTPAVINKNREANLGEVKFAFIAAPPDDINDPDIVTHDVYRRVIDFARRNADLVIMDTQIIESADRTGVVTQLILPALVHDAWGVGIADMTNVGVNNLNNRLRKFLREGVPVDRLMVMINKVHPDQVEMASKAVNYFTGRATFLGSIEMDPAIHQDMNAGRITIQNRQMHRIMSQILFRVTGNEAFELQDEEPEAPVKGRGKAKKKRAAAAASPAAPKPAAQDKSSKGSFMDIIARLVPGKKGE